MNAWVTQLRKGLMEFCILNLLRRGESYGYEILQSLRSIDELAVTESTIYPILSRLRKEGYLHIRIKASQEGPPRKYFYLTAVGKHHIAEMNTYWTSLHEAIEKLRRHEKKTEDSDETTP